jgi:hypothetical protein
MAAVENVADPKIIADGKIMAEVKITADSKILAIDTKFFHRAFVNSCMM